MSDVKLHQFQVKVGEPVLFLRGDDPLAAKLVQHYLAMLSVDPRVDAKELTDVAHLADAMIEWQKAIAPKKE